jgi:hypothetical protein
LPAGGTKPVNLLMADMAQELIGAARTTSHRFGDIQLGIKKGFYELENSVRLRREVNV